MTVNKFIDECHSFLLALNNPKWTYEQINLGFTGLLHGYLKCPKSAIVSTYMERCKTKYEKYIGGT